MADPTDVVRRKYGWGRSKGFSPLYESLAEVILAEPGMISLLDEAPPTQRTPSLLFAALHDRVMANPGEPLARWFPSVTGQPVPTEDPGPALRAFFAAHAGELRRLIATRKTQTTDPQRAAPLVFAFDRVRSWAGGRRLALVELGPSAGLLLRFDKFHYEFPDLGVVGSKDSPVRISCELRGPKKPPLPASLPEIGTRVGIDLAPIDVNIPAETRWLEACVLADQVERLAKLRAALALARRHRVAMLRGDFVERLAGLVAEVPADEYLCLLNSYSLFYLTEDQRISLTQIIAGLAGGRDLSWISVERPGTIPGLIEPAPPAESFDTFLSVTRFISGTRDDEVLARCHVHGNWLEWI